MQIHAKNSSMSMMDKIEIIPSDSVGGLPWFVMRICRDPT